MGKSLVIVEVSQKQAYIFSSNKLRKNIMNSAIIAYVTSNKFFSEAAGNLYCPAENEVYCGGGHAILQFENPEKAKKFVSKITWAAKQKFPGLELFAAFYECEGGASMESISALMKKLERKKSVRRSSFIQGLFGVEEIDSASRTVNIEKIKIDGKKIADFVLDDELDKRLYPEGYERAMEFQDLGGSKGDSNFIAVVHIDGNAMGARVEAIQTMEENKDWLKYCENAKKFSEGIDSAFKDAFKEMCEQVAENIEGGSLGEIELKQAENKKLYFPIRRVITEGDDICFVTEGRIGLECARIFIECLKEKRNPVDQQGYAAAAGVAVVHQKYPFYMAYELAESLCSNAKKYIANSTKDMEDVDSSKVSAIDWHIEYGELKDHIEEIRETYTAADGSRMEMRPYVLDGPEKYLQKERMRRYSNFRKQMLAFDDKKNMAARGKLKELRGYIREGETAVSNYIEKNLLRETMLQIYLDIYEPSDLSLIGTGTGQAYNKFVQTTDQKYRSIIFDAIEMMDSYIALN